MKSRRFKTILKNFNKLTISMFKKTTSSDKSNSSIPEIYMVEILRIIAGFTDETKEIG
jgi:hypothetical protein